MPAFRFSLFALAFAPAIATLVVACATPDVDAPAAITRAEQAMGGTALKSLRYSADGTGYTFGQAYTPDMPWPKITVNALTRSINYDSASMRDEITISRAEPK